MAKNPALFIEIESAGLSELHQSRLADAWRRFQSHDLPDELPGPEIFKDGYWHVTQSKKENKMSELEIRERAINIAALHLTGEDKDAAKLIAMAKQVYEYLTASAPVSPAKSSK